VDWCSVESVEAVAGAFDEARRGVGPNKPSIKKRKPSDCDRPHLLMRSEVMQVSKEAHRTTRTCRRQLQQHQCTTDPCTIASAGCPDAESEREIERQTVCRWKRREWPGYKVQAACGMHASVPHQDRPRHDLLCTWKNVEKRG